MVKRRQTGASDPMDRRESALWLGRALSTHEVTLRALLQLLDISQRQQQLIVLLSDEVQRLGADSDQAARLQHTKEQLVPELEKELETLRARMVPLVEMVDQSCSQLQKMLE